jgi:hypothetical protein
MDGTLLYHEKQARAMALPKKSYMFIDNILLGSLVCQTSSVVWESGIPCMACCSLPSS